MFEWWGRTVVRLRWAVIAAGVVLAVAGATWGAGVFGVLTGGGISDKSSESSHAEQVMNDRFGNQTVDLLVLYSSPTATVDQPEFRDPVGQTLTKLRQRSDVVGVTSFYDTNAPNMVSTDRHETYAIVQLAGGDDADAKVKLMPDLRPALEAPGLTTVVGGNIAFIDEVSKQSQEDIARAESLSIPVLLILLIIIFGGVVAASMPLLVGILAILGAFVATRLLTTVTEISTFAINMITLLGMGLAIDYALFVVSRFREELAAGRDTPEAISRTLATAGRTVMVSAVIIASALASILIFPLVFLRSIALGGIAAVLVAAVAALTVLPATLAALGPRIDKLRIPLRRRRAAGTAAEGHEGVWAKLAHSVMRRPVLYIVGVVVVLAFFATPFLRFQLGGFDERVFPEDSQTRIVSSRIERDFPGGNAAPIQVVVTGASADAFAGQIREVPGVTGVAPAAAKGDATLLNVTYTGKPTGGDAQDAVREIRKLPAPSGATVLVGGRTANDVDLLNALNSRLPWMVLILTITTMAVLFLAFGSVVLPIKAVLMSAVSIMASFGVVVWGFQEGHLANLLHFTSTGFTEMSSPVLMLAVLFGLSTDYEVFLLSRIREEWDRTGDNTASVATGLQRTGRIITAAAILLIIVVAGFSTSGISFLKMIGVGMIVAILVDATLVRALLVPATMRLLGHWNWWAPGPLARVYRRYGIREDAPEGELQKV